MKHEYCMSPKPSCNCTLPVQFKFASAKETSKRTTVPINLELQGKILLATTTFGCSTEEENAAKRKRRARATSKRIRADLIATSLFSDTSLELAILCRQAKRFFTPQIL
ncbi:Hypothetical predicted protein [Prunus dulcis]|uniref:Uncharacterized protein n=1 Tax=Prunus dulcis TaxID=3755 RepID=A0A5E4E458_PRUDU|nr:Hypothetical predicted protein [Prunus dulcis]